MGDQLIACAKKLWKYRGNWQCPGKKICDRKWFIVNYTFGSIIPIFTHGSSYCFQRVL